MGMLVLAWAGMFVVGFYQAFIGTFFWSWFVAPALHVSDISFWIIYGLIMTINVFRSSDSAFLEREHHEHLTKILMFCVPEAFLEAAKQELADSVSINKVMFSLVGQALGLTSVLAMGFVVHILAGTF